MSACACPLFCRTQAFAGPACTPPPAQLHCQCLHLTDFSGGATPKLAAASLDQMLSFNPGAPARPSLPPTTCLLSPLITLVPARLLLSVHRSKHLTARFVPRNQSLAAEDIITKLRYLAAIVFGLFGLMLALSAFAFAHDTRSRNKLLRVLRSRLFQFKEDPMTGAWTWAVQTGGELEEDEMIGHHSGPLAALAMAIGVPAIRLRFALPQEWVPGEMGAHAAHAVGSPFLCCQSAKHRHRSW